MATYFYTIMDIHSQHYRDLCRYHIGYEITWRLFQTDANLSEMRHPKLCIWIAGGIHVEVREADNLPDATGIRTYNIADLLMEEVVRDEEGRKTIVCRPDPRKVTAVAESWVNLFLSLGLRLNPATIPQLEEGLRFFLKEIKKG